MQVCIHTYIHTYILTYIHICIHTCMHTHIHICIHTYMHTYILTYIHTWMHSYIHTSIHTYMHSHIHTYIQAYINTHKYTHKHIQIHTGPECRVPQLASLSTPSTPTLDHLLTSTYDHRERTNKETNKQTCNSLPSRWERSLLCTSPSVCNSRGVFPNVFAVKFRDFTLI